MMFRICLLFTVLAPASAVKADGSAVQSVIQLLQGMQAKTTSDLEQESQTMEEKLKFCSDETKEKGFSMKTADRQISDLMALIQESKATIAEKSDEISTLGSTISSKEKEFEVASKNREAQASDFAAAEKELADAVDSCARAAAALAKGMSFAQTHGRRGMRHMEQKMEAIRLALSSVVSAAWIDAESANKLKSFLQQSEQQSEGNADDLSLRSYQPQGKEVAYESKSGAIVEMVKETQKKAEKELSELRKKEMENSHTFQMLAASLKDEISINKERLASASAAKTAAQEAQGTAEADRVTIEKSKASDQQYADSLRAECETEATEWESRQRSAQGELAALKKAEEILSQGVTALVQISSRTRRFHAEDVEDEDDTRKAVVMKLRSMGRKFHSFALVQMASMAASDPFVKIRGLISDMIASLVKQAQEEATQKAFCDTELGKSQKSKDDRMRKLDKYQARLDKAETGKAELSSAVKQLETEIHEIDKAQAEATKLRVAEKEENTKAMKDFKDSADAVISAMGVLKQFYSGDSAAFLQTSGDGSSIISVLEVAESDFTRLFAETEAAEEEAASAYETLSTENKVSKATKQAEAKGKISEIKGLELALSQAKEDHTSVGEELDAVLAYLDKLKPQCETKSMSYEEKVARRNAEIDGLKEALSILEGKDIPALLQSEASFRSLRRY